MRARRRFHSLSFGGITISTRALHAAASRLPQDTPRHCCSLGRHDSQRFRFMLTAMIAPPLTATRHAGQVFQADISIAGCATPLLAIQCHFAAISFSALPLARCAPIIADAAKRHTACRDCRHSQRAGNTAVQVMMGAMPACRDIAS